jgi:hypothetical protein
MQGRFDGFTGILLAFDSCLLRGLFFALLQTKLSIHLQILIPKFSFRGSTKTRAADLEAGALTLKTDLKGRTQQKKQLVKENFDYLVSCKTTIDGNCVVVRYIHIANKCS